MTLNSQSFAIIAFLMFEENTFRVCCFSIYVHYSIARVRANLRIVSAPKLSLLHLFRAADMSLARKFLN